MHYAASAGASEAALKLLKATVRSLSNGHTHGSPPPPPEQATDTDGLLGFTVDGVRCVAGRQPLGCRGIDRRVVLRYDACTGPPPVFAHPSPSACPTMWLSAPACCVSARATYRPPAKDHSGKRSVWAAGSLRPRTATRRPPYSSRARVLTSPRPRSDGRVEAKVRVRTTAATDGAATA